MLNNTLTKQEKTLTPLQSEITEILYKHYGSDFAVYKKVVDDFESLISSKKESWIREGKDCWRCKLWHEHKHPIGGKPQSE